MEVWPPTQEYRERWWEVHLDGAALTQSLSQTKTLVMGEVVKELLALSGRFPASNLVVDLPPGPPPLPQATSQVSNVLLHPVSIA